MSNFQAERVGDGVLLSLGEDASLLFESRADAERVGRQLMLAATYGTDALDDLQAVDLGDLDG